MYIYPRVPKNTFGFIHTHKDVVDCRYEGKYIELQKKIKKGYSKCKNLGVILKLDQVPFLEYLIA